MNKKLVLFIIVFGVILFIVARSWVPVGMILGGHDSGLAINASQFFSKRLLSWDATVNFGVDNSAYFGSLTMHGLDLILARLGGTSFAGNTLNVFFWIFLMFLSATVLSLELKKYFGKAITFILPIFLVMNFYIFQSMFILERAKYGIYIATLLILTILFRLKRKQISVFISSLLIAILLVIFNGGSWLGIPLFGGFIVVIITFLFAELFFSVKQRSFKDLKKILITLLLSIAFLFALSTYSWLPYIGNFVKSDAQILSDQGSINGNEAWLDNMSQGTSILNLIRFQGTPDWYASSNQANPEHQYAGLYINNNFLIVVSFTFPFLALFSLLPISKEKDLKKRSVGVFFILLSFLSLIFVAGSHPPTGEIYKLLFTRIPGFIIFRSPYYKFGYAFMLGWSVLIAISISYFLKRFSGVKLLVGIIIVNVFVIGYYSPILSPSKLFHWKNDFSTVFSLPPYVNQYANWADMNTKDGRTLLLPPNNDEWRSDGYNFGYWSTTTLLASASNIEVLSNDSLLNQAESTWVNAIYGAIKKGDEKNFNLLADKLGVKYFLVRADVLSGKWSAPEDFSIYENALKGFPSVTKLNKFGNWVVYSRANIHLTDFTAINNLTHISSNDLGYMGKLYQFSQAFTNKDSKDSISVLTCDICKMLEAIDPKNQLQLSTSTILPNSILYKLKQMRRNYNVSHLAGDKDVRTNYYLGELFSLGGEFKAINLNPIEDSFQAVVFQQIKDDVDALNSLVMSEKRSQTDYLLAANIFKYTEPIEGFIAQYFRSFPSASLSMQSQLQALDWEIRSLNDHFSLVWDSLSSTVNRKSYPFTISRNGVYQLFIKNDMQLGGVLKAGLQKEGSFLKQLSVGSDGTWLATGKISLEAGSYDLVIDIPPSGNVLQTIMTANFNNPYSSYISCLGGQIDQFSPEKKYMISLSSSGTLDLYFRENKEDLPSYFLPPKNQLSPIFLKTGNINNYFYSPFSTAKNSAIYVCGTKSSLNGIDNLTVSEIRVPEVILRSYSDDVRSIPSITADKISSIKYIVNVPTETGEFTLRFGERFDPRWQARYLDNNQLIGNHVIIDGYANGWVIPQISSRKIVIEYSTQNKFNLGVIVSLVSFCLLSIVFFVKIVLKKNEIPRRK